MTNPKCVLFFWSVEKSNSVVGSDILDSSAILYRQRLNIFGVVLTYLEHFMLWRPSWISPSFCIRKKGHKIFIFLEVHWSPNYLIKPSICERKVFSLQTSPHYQTNFFLSSKSAKTHFFEKKLVKFGQNCVMSLMKQNIWKSFKRMIIDERNMWILWIYDI
jgi:hypothetical protein